MAHKYKKHKSYAAAQSSFNYLLIPLIIIISVIPLIVYMKEYHNGLDQYDFFSTNDTTIDFFLYNKALAFIIVSTILACIMIVKLCMEGRKIKFTKIFIPLGVYGLLAVLSAIFSEHAKFSFSGIYEQFESVWVLLGYCLVAYYAFLFINTEKDIHCIITALTIGTIIILLIGMSQAFSHDFYRTNLGKSLIVPPKTLSQGDFDFTFELGRVYLTLYNPNYVGSYAALISPIFLLLIFSAKKYLLSALYAVIYVGLLLVLFGSESRAGFVGIAASLVFIAVIFNKQLIKHWMPVVCILTLCVCTFLTMDNLQDGALINKVKSIFSPAYTEIPVKGIETNDNNIVVDYNGNKLSVEFSFNDTDYTFSLIPKDSDGNLVNCTLGDDGLTYTVDDERFPNLTLSPVTIEKYVGFAVTINGKPWYFTNKIDGTYHFYCNYGKFVKLNNSESLPLLENYGAFASGRGFIWSKTIPLLKDNILLGSGPDTFVFEFPNNDYVDMAYNGYENQVMTKPHNMYLQIGVQTGVLSLIAVLVFYCWYLFTGIALYIRLKKQTYLSLTGIGILSGSFGYMVVAIINDSTIALAPIYWCLIGVGIAINMMVKSSLLADNVLAAEGSAVNVAKQGKKNKQKA